MSPVRQLEQHGTLAGVSVRSGLGGLELAVLDVVAEVCGQGAGPFRTTSRVLDLLESRHGLGARYAYPLIQDLAAPWRLHLPLLDAQGQLGSQHGDTAAPAQYTGVRLSRVGALVLAAERGQIGPVPWGLVEGSLYRGGLVPPFAPDRVVAALCGGRPDAGPPVLPTAATVEGDVEGLLAGRRVRLAVGCAVSAEPGRLVVTAVPPGARVEDLVRSLASRLRGRGDPPPISGVRDESPGRPRVRVVCTLATGADPDAAWAWVRQVWPARADVDCQLPAPMRARLAGWGRGDGSGLAALARLLAGPA